MPAKKTNNKFMAPVQPNDALAAIVGNKPLPRTEIVKKLWEYFKAHDLQDKKNKRCINADAKLKPLFGKDQITMFEVGGIVGRNLKA